MSDLDDDFMQMSEDEDDFSFEYDDDDDEDQDELMEDNNNINNNDEFSSTDNNQDQDFESLYYNAKATKEEDISQSILQFQHIISSKHDINDQITLEYIFKSVKQILKLHHHLGQIDQLMATLPKLFEILPKLTNKAYGEESINKLVSHYDKPKADSTFLINFLDMTIQGVIDSYGQKNLPNSRFIPQDRLWLILNLKKSNLLIRNNENAKALKLLSSLQEICETSTENIKGSYMLEIIALQIQLYSDLPDTFSILKELYDKSFQINSAVPHPKIMGIINECGGEILMKQSNYNRASNEFYESFKNYDELGDDKRILLLKRLMISNMLSESEINPFHAKEFQSFVKLDEIKIFLRLYNSFINVDIENFNLLIEQNTNPQGLIFDDLFFTTYVEELKSKIQIRTIIKLTKYYSKFELDHLSEILHCDLTTTRTHLLKLISSGKLVNLKIDFVENFFEIIESTEENIRILGNINADDIINNMKKLESEMETVDEDGDHLMEQELPQPSKVPVNEIIRDRPDCIKLTSEMFTVLSLLVGNINHITTRNDDDDKSKTFTIYNIKLQSVLQEWLNILLKSLPVKTADKLSQIEQVKLEQQQQQQQQETNNDTLNVTSKSEVEQETLMGELVVDQNITDNDVMDNDYTKNSAIRCLIKSMVSYQDRLMTFHDDKMAFAVNVLKSIRK